MRAEKQLLLDEIRDKITDSSGFIITRYQNFSAMKARAFRNHVADVGGEFEVVKKRVFLKAALSLGITFDDVVFEGHVGIVFTQEDAAQLAKRTVQYSEDHDQSILVLGGQIDGEFCSAQEVETLAKLPSFRELQAQILGLFEAPLTQTVGTMQAVLTGILYCLEEKSKKE